jgi:hypothetical protein
VRFELQRLARETRRQRLFPLENVPALDFTVGVLMQDFARQVYLEADDLRSVPADIADIPPDRGTYRLPELEHIVAAIEPVRGPRQWRDLRQLPDVGDVDADMNEPAAVAARERHHGVASGWSKKFPHLLTVEPRFGIDAQVEAAQGDERGDRGIDVRRRRAVERQVEFLLVLVLPAEHAAARDRRQRRDERQRMDGAAISRGHKAQ